MWRLTYCTSFLLVALSLAPVQKVTACMCSPEHPQNQFCKSDFVAIVRVKGVMTRNDQYLAYSVKINKILKSNPKSELALRKNILWTPSEDSLCAVNFKPRDTYIIGGYVLSGQAHINLCRLSIPWANVKSKQRHLFKRLYAKGCACEIKFTQWSHKGAVLESTEGKRCLWESSPGPNDCQEKYGVCLPRLGGCTWHPTMAYNSCIKDHRERQRERQRPRELVLN